MQASDSLTKNKSYKKDSAEQRKYWTAFQKPKGGVWVHNGNMLRIWDHSSVGENYIQPIKSILLIKRSLLIGE